MHLKEVEGSSLHRKKEHSKPQLAIDTELLRRQVLFPTVGQRGVERGIFFFCHHLGDEHRKPHSALSLECVGDFRSYDGVSACSVWATEFLMVLPRKSFSTLPVSA